MDRRDEVRRIAELVTNNSEELNRRLADGPRADEGTSRVNLVRDGTGWSAAIPGTPIAADGATLDEGLDEMVDALRDYVEAWNEYLTLAPNHAANKTLVDLTDGKNDDELHEWVAAGDDGDAQREYNTSPVLRDALRRAREARSVKRVFRRATGRRPPAHAEPVSRHPWSSTLRAGPPK